MSFPTLRRLLLVLAAAAIASTLLVAPSPAAASTSALVARGTKIVAAAQAQKGKPYKYGARGPSAFDCSGLAGFAYAKGGIKLPRTAQAQYRAARKITKAAARPGDLVFWVTGRRAYHVAVYAGAGQVWHAPKPGDRVKLAKIWNWKQVRFARVGG
ncbi:C40 family peptidase [Actinoplanes sp. TRM 88003]|uniref:C40 family peptidase n=1 Tax=Paractinoplanes aksuensis TaxID=2939490 RepID=A0ABT1DLX4_9ACTN|nr:C40 family peptidase [Actinoplanes aksuensis]MCO8271832.1 C40 family peptidase [Actinoplanes aksuensis]